MQPPLHLPLLVAWAGCRLRWFACDTPCDYSLSAAELSSNCDSYQLMIGSMILCSGCYCRKNAQILCYNAVLHLEASGSWLYIQWKRYVIQSCTCMTLIMHFALLLRRILTFPFMYYHAMIIIDVRWARPESRFGLLNSLIDCRGHQVTQSGEALQSAMAGTWLELGSPILSCMFVLLRAKRLTA